MFRTKLVTVVSVLVLSLFGVTQGHAQSASIQATATVLTPLTVTAVSDLMFGDVFPGVAKTVAATDPTAGRFNVSGQLGGEVALNFTTPSTLVSGANSLPIGSWTGIRHTANNPNAGVSLDPSMPDILANLDAVTGNLYVWLGATVSPTSTQAAGYYTGSVQMEVVYTGN